MSSYEEIIQFWFEEITPAQWWQKDPAFDQLISDRFLSLHQQASLCELFSWRENPKGRLAEVIILDQFSRNIYRDKPAAFACDALAVALTQEAILQKADLELRQVERSFLYMPLMHSESPLIQDLSIAYHRKNGNENTLDFALKHKVIIDQFGRYPHRNAILGRSTTAEEEEFLGKPGSSF